MKNKIASKIFMAMIMIFFYMPIVYTVVFSFNGKRSLTRWAGFSLEWYEKMLSNDSMMSALWTTVTIAIFATIISTLVGTITAIGLSKSNKILKSVIERINDFPIMNPEIVTAIGLLMLFSALSIEKGYLTMLAAHIMFCTPYVMLSVGPKLRSLDPNLADAALDLGATPWQALIKVIVPQIMPGVVSGALIAFTMSFDDFIISYFVTGNGVSNISILVYTMSKRINPSINALSTVIIFIITVTLIIINILPLLKSRKKKGVNE